MLDGTKAFIKELRARLSGSSQSEAVEIFNLMSAIRGPDSADPDTKHRTTARLRGALLGRPASSRLPGMDIDHNHQAVEIPGDSQRIAEYASSHFYNHIRWAAKLLDLQIEEDSRDVSESP